MKQVPIIDATEAARLVNSGDTLLVGGFGMTGNPVHLVHALAERSEVRNLTYVGNNVGETNLSGGRLLVNGQLGKVIGSYFTSNRDAVTAVQSGDLEASLLPQGTLAEAIRAGGAGIGGFYTPTGVGTSLTEYTESRIIQGREQIFVEGIRGDVAFVRAWRSDSAGNLQYRLTERNFNQVMATAADIVVAEVEEFEESEFLDPDQIHTPGCFVDYLVPAKLTEDLLGTSANISYSEKRVDTDRMNIARAALEELTHGDVVNLGIGIPTLVADLITPEHGIILHSENGMIGVGPEPGEGGAMNHPVNAGKIPVTAMPGASYFDSSQSFGMIRGGHVDVAIMGGLQIDEHGNLANWAVPGRPLLGVGGAMDLARGAKKLIITMLQTDRDGRSKLVDRCTLPLTASGVVDIVITELGVFRFIDGELSLTSLMPGVSLDQVAANTSASFVTKL